MLKIVAGQASVGIAKRRTSYDLPLQKGAGPVFLGVLIGLMVFLATLAIAASFAMGALKDRWTAGLENTMTIEIPAEGGDASARSPEEISQIANRIDAMLSEQSAIDKTEILSRADVAEMVEPWLGSLASSDNVPLPGLISVTLRPDEKVDTKALQSALTGIDSASRLDGNQEWLQDVLRFSSALQWAAFFLVAVVGATAAAAVTGAVHSLMAVLGEQIGLLHLMGATDQYISRQFQRHAAVLSLWGGASGAAAGLLTFLLAGVAAGNMGIDAVPDFSLRWAHLIVIAFLPGAAALLSIVAARNTVHRVLEGLP